MKHPTYVIPFIYVTLLPSLGAMDLLVDVSNSEWEHVDKQLAGQMSGRAPDFLFISCLCSTTICICTSNGQIINFCLKMFVRQ
jgi:hypothetical protein